MKVRLRYMDVIARRTTERIEFAETITFIHGPVSTGKSTVARLIDYCFGGNLERTPAIQQEFVAVQLAVELGNHSCTIERAADDNSALRVSWTNSDGSTESVNAPFRPQEAPLVDELVYNFSDLVFYLCGVSPIKVRQRSREVDSPLVRLSIRDIWPYCYLEQTHLDSSFYRLEDPFKGRKSQDAMRFITGLYSERQSQLEAELANTLDQQRAKREAVQQIREFMARFALGTDLDIAGQLQILEQELSAAIAHRQELFASRSTQIHPTDALRDQLRSMSLEIEDLQRAVADSSDMVSQQKALRAEMITAKTKSLRIQEAGRVLDGAQFDRCPECGSNIGSRTASQGRCRLCGTDVGSPQEEQPLELEVLRRDLNERIDELTDSIRRKEESHLRLEKKLRDGLEKKAIFDKRLQDELARYDSAYVESIRDAERVVATLEERLASIQRLQEMPRAIDELVEQAGSLQGRVDRLRSSLTDERGRLAAADANVAAIAARFKEIMISVGFPGVFESDDVILDPRNWRPVVLHEQQMWNFWDTGSGGKKTLFNVCYALALHSVARERGFPLPTLIIIDSPTKNISEDENPNLVHALYSEIYNLAMQDGDEKLQFLLVDSDLVPPDQRIPGFATRRMAGEPDAPSLISYYTGP